MARVAIERHGISIRLACICLGISESCYHYQCKFSDENAFIANWLLRLTEAQKRWGFGFITTKGRLRLLAASRPNI